MKFIEVEKSVREKEWSMSDLHAHSHYELYFLISGTREFFLTNKMFKISAPCVIVIPPYTMHKTEGVGFTRINLNIAPDALGGYETAVLIRLGEKIINLSRREYEEISAVLEKSLDETKKNSPFSGDKLKTLVSYAIYLLDGFDPSHAAACAKSNLKNVSPVYLRLIDFLNENYDKDFSLEDLSKKFYISKVSLCAGFKKAMNTTINEYVTEIRLNKAKQYLATSDKSVEEISYLCGFSSAAYFGIVFKNKTGLSPLGYRKLEKSKE